MWTPIRCRQLSMLPLGLTKFGGGHWPAIIFRLMLPPRPTTWPRASTASVCRTQSARSTLTLPWPMGELTTTGVAKWGRARKVTAARTPGVAEEGDAHGGDGSANDGPHRDAEREGEGGVEHRDDPAQVEDPRGEPVESRADEGPAPPGDQPGEEGGQHDGAGAEDAELPGEP